MKNEMFYGRSFVGITIETFIQIINDYIVWYNTKRIKELYEEQNGTHYCTYLYFYDGALRELFTQASNVPSADMGTATTELSGFTFSVESAPDGSESVLLITVTDTEGRNNTARIHLSAAALSKT